MRWTRYYAELIKKAIRGPVAFVSVIALILTLVGGFIGNQRPELESTIKFMLWIIPLAVLCVAVFIGFLIAPYTIHKETVIKEARDYLKYDADARLDKAHRVFYHLHREGLIVKNSAPKWVAEWDENVRKAFIDYCNEGVLNMYLLNSGRASELKPLEMRQVDWALSYIGELLASTPNFRNRLKPV